MLGKAIYRQVAAIHAAEINEGFLALLGPGFLELMYQAIDESPGSVLFVEMADDRVVGFVAGTRDMGPIYRRMMRNWVRLGFALLPSLVRPHRVWRILEILRYGGGDGAAELPPHELLSIAVDRRWRGKGVAPALYQRLAAHFREAGADGFRIAVGDVLDTPHHFYRKMGAVPAAKIEVHRGQTSTIYVHSLRAT